MITTTEAIENGTGNDADVVSVTWLVSKQFVPLVWNPLGHSLRQAPLYSE